MEMRKSILTKIDGVVTIKSTDLVDIINQFRQVEGNRKELLHKTFMEKIRKELKSLANAGIKGEQNFLPTSYIDNWNREKPCFELNRNGMIQMLNSESPVVRFKTTEYIDKLESELEQMTTMLSKEQQLIMNMLIAKTLEESKEASIELDKYRKEQILLKEQKIKEDKPLVELAKERLDKNGLVSITDCTKTFKLKRGQLTKWGKEQGYLHKAITEVNKKVSLISRCIWVALINVLE